MSRVDGLTATSYSILGLLAIQPWTTYELTQQMDRSLGRIWPRAVSKLYEEPKKLVAAGFARASQEHVGKRPRTVYTITPRGRRALVAWLSEPGDGPVLEFEQLLKIFFADSGTKADIVTQLDAARAWARERNQGNIEAGRSYFAGEGQFQERANLTLLAGRFLTDFYSLIDEWARWALEVIDGWPDDLRDAEADPAQVLDVLRRAERLPPPPTE